MTDVNQNQVSVLTALKGMAVGVIAGNITATTTAAKIPETPSAFRKSIMVRNDSGQIAYIGTSNVTNAGANGFLFKNGEILSLDLDSSVDLYVVLAASTGTIYYVEGS